MKRTHDDSDGLNGILPAVKYRVPTKHLHTRGSTAVFVLPAQFADYMKLAGVGPRSTLRDAALNEIGKAVSLEVIHDVTTIHVELEPGQSVPAGHLQTSFKISRGRSAPTYYVLQSIYPEMRHRR
jgi:hypothetical protein